MCPRKKKSPINVSDFTEAQLWLGYGRCRDNVKGLLHGASLLLNDRNSQQYALGLRKICYYLLSALWLE